MLSDIAPNLRTFFVPQMQQLSLRERPVRCGAYSEACEEWGSGSLWVMSVGDDCLISVHDITLRETLRLFEYPSDYACLAAMSRATATATLQCVPVTCPHVLNENVMSFHQGGGEVSFELQAGQRYASRTISFTPRFFKRLARAYPGDFDLLAETLASTPANTLPPAVARVLENLTPTRANLPGADLYFTSKVMEAVSIIMGDATQRADTREQDSVAESAKIAREAKALIDKRFGEALTLQSIADHIYVSRTHLCTAFKQETGASVGTYLREVRMRRAFELLSTTSLPVAEVSRAVGYSRQSSFAEAFKNETGITPSQWRKGARK